MEHPLCQLRRRMNLTQEAFANLIEAPRVAISKVERGYRALQLGELVAIARVCRLTDEQAMDLARALGASDQAEVFTALTQDAA